jgi:ankyrin repeat protein
MSSQLVLFAWLLAITIGVFLVVRLPTHRRWAKLLVPGLIVIWVAGGMFLISVLLKDRSFFQAVESGDLKRAKKLLAENPALIGSKTFVGNSPLHVAVASGNLQVVNLLIDAGSDVNAKGDSGAAPLHLAAVAGNCPITSALLKAGARVDSRGFRHNDTPLHIAARYGRAEVARLLLEHGANPSAKNMLNQTPLQIAKEHHQAAVITLLEESAQCGG